MGASSRPARRRLKPAALLRPIAGPPHTETSYETFRVKDLAQVATFYRTALPQRGWTEEAGDPTGAARVGQTLNFDKGRFVTSVSFTQVAGSGEFSISVTHLPPELQLSPPASGTGSPTPS